ncbi:unnamed protein product [Linum trigynum]|uniref:ZF-HD dimerization-type domain-containing protein n=1 Tax=Linum trigynum TaxID=586398 RepID=A0AAV2DBJ4_9ROSI
MGSSTDDEGPNGGRAALMCTSCGCHRNFDRPKVDPSAVLRNSRWCPREQSTTRESSTMPISAVCHC